MRSNMFKQLQHWITTCCLSNWSGRNSLEWDSSLVKGIKPVVFLFSVCYFKDVKHCKGEQQQVFFKNASVPSMKWCVLLAAESIIKLSELYNKQTCIGWRCEELFTALQFLQNFLVAQLHAAYLIMYFNHLKAASAWI